MQLLQCTHRAEIPETPETSAPLMPARMHNVTRARAKFPRHLRAHYLSHPHFPAENLVPRLSADENCEENVEAEC